MPSGDGSPHAYVMICPDPALRGYVYKCNDCALVSIGKHAHGGSPRARTLIARIRRSAVTFTRATIVHWFVMESTRTAVVRGRVRLLPGSGAPRLRLQGERLCISLFCMHSNVLACSYYV